MTKSIEQTHIPKKSEGKNIQRYVLEVDYEEILRVDSILLKRHTKCEHVQG
jgi:hypothetical protein